jgi:type IV pilus assembly protein PilE
MLRSQRGFTLTELMIVVAIVIILTAVAVPNYNRQVLRSHRTDAKSALLRVAAEQEKFYLQNNSYGDLDDLNNPTTDNGWYTLAIPVANATTFTVTATATAGGPQVFDEDCITFSLNAAGTRGALDSEDADNTEVCW